MIKSKWIRLLCVFLLLLFSFNEKGLSADLSSEIESMIDKTKSSLEIHMGLVNELRSQKQLIAHQIVTLDRSLHDFVKYFLDNTKSTSLSLNLSICRKMILVTNAKMELSSQRYVSKCIRIKNIQENLIILENSLQSFKDIKKDISINVDVINNKNIILARNIWSNIETLLKNKSIEQPDESEMDNLLNDPILLEDEKYFQNVIEKYQPE